MSKNNPPADAAVLAKLVLMLSWYLNPSKNWEYSSSTRNDMLEVVRDEIAKVSPGVMANGLEQLLLDYAKHPLKGEVEAFSRLFLSEAQSAQSKRRP